MLFVKLKLVESVKILSDNPGNYLKVHSFIHSFINLFKVFIYLFIYLFIHLFIYLGEGGSAEGVFGLVFTNSLLTIKTSKQFIVSFKAISNIVLLFPLFVLNK